MEPKLTPEQKEAQEILKSIEKSKSKLPDKEKNILEWTTEELKSYIVSETAGMSVKKKLKFGKEILKRIEEEKKKQRKN